MSFSNLGLCTELLKTIKEQAYNKPTAIQRKAIPEVLDKRDIIAVAHTGTGKTAAFTLPILQLLGEGSTLQARQIKALIITPTRELAAQVMQNIQTYSKYININCSAAFGGVRIEPQIAKLQEGIDILVVTPGRLIDLYKQQKITFNKLEILVLDEADRMLDLGFIDDIRYIKSLLPSKIQTLMFSATFSKDVKLLAKSMLNKPIVIQEARLNTVADTVKHRVHPVDSNRKSELLIHLLKKNQWHQVIVFSRTKHTADNLVVKLKKSAINTASIHSNRTQHARTQVLEGFQNGSIKVLVATDIASRGIDVKQLPCVINYNLPEVPEDYIHRVGRTGRAGALGLAISLYSDNEIKQLKSIERVLNHKFEYELISGFTPNKKAPLKKKVKIEDDDDEYGNFEPDLKPLGRGNINTRKSHSRKTSTRFHK